MQETINAGYQNKVITVVGGDGQFGRKIVRGLKDLGLQVLNCEKGDPFLDLLGRSDGVFFAIDGEQTREMLQAGRHLLRPGHLILDGASVKTSLIPLYRDLDREGINVCSTHFGAVPTQPWRGIPVWLCTVGENSEEAKRLAIDLYIAKNTAIRVIDIKEHPRVEKDQFFTFSMMHIFASTLRRMGIPLEEFTNFATLNAELASLPLGRTLGQGTKTPSEILFDQPQKEEFLEEMSLAFQEFVDASRDREKLQKLMGGNIAFHDSFDGGRMGYVARIFRKAGIVGSRNANLRMYSLSFRITDDRPGKLIELLIPFYDEGANLTAIDSMAGIITQAEEEQGVNSDKIVDFDIGIDPKTWNEEKDRRIMERLRAIGCTISYSGHQLI